LLLLLLLPSEEPFESDKVGEDGAGGDRGANDSMPLMVALADEEAACGETIVKSERLQLPPLFFPELLLLLLLL
jgi:hypothetical protein